VVVVRWVEDVRGGDRDTHSPIGHVIRGELSCQAGDLGSYCGMSRLDAAI